MSEAKHTPGPWIAKCDDVRGNLDVGDDGVRFWSIQQEGSVEDGYRGTVCTVSDAVCIRGITIAERNANARLIAAAPTMLDALQSARHTLANALMAATAEMHIDDEGYDPSEHVTIKEIDAAIRMAEGRS